MSALLSFLFVVVPVAAVVWIVWRYRRAAEDKEIARREREAALVEMVKQRAAAITPASPAAATLAPVPAPAVASDAPTAGSPVPVAEPVAQAAAPAAAAALSGSLPASAVDTAATAVDGAAAGERRNRFLTHSETLVYLLLRSGIPGHEVFPRASLASVIENLPPAAGSSMDAAANPHALDFVICDRRMRIVAAVQLEGRLSGPERARVEATLGAAGIRLVTFDVRALPKRDQVSALVLGLPDDPSGLPSLGSTA